MPAPLCFGYFEDFPVNGELQKATSISFAISKIEGVSRLELDLTSRPFPLSLDVREHYSIPLNLFNKTKGMEPYLMQLHSVLSIPTSCVNVQNGFRSLRELVLKFVDVADELFETILSGCTSLECLYLLHSRRLVNLKHTVPHLKLKCLEEQAFSKVPIFCNLKHLSLTSYNNFKGQRGVQACYQMAVCFLKASPFLHRLELNFELLPDSVGSHELRRVPISQHKHLKEVFVSGFYGQKTVTDFIRYIVDDTIALEKIEITCYVDAIDPDAPVYLLKDVARVKASIRELRQNLPGHTQLKFLDNL
ncbi:Leucine-rich repeat 2 [Corchorus olitorius]|uniref:Leucine-rich repeat 2 n=1 Tax=Corchorus olitorius TaxID=93759 RepID=A0A1R3I6B9_9ROSI|nr:Leucine-rich repeat 2 [Corchorus olitorius]